MPRDFVPKHKFSSASCVSGGQAEAQQRHKPLTSTERSQLLSDQPGGSCTTNSVPVRVSYRIFGWGGGRNTDSTCVGMHEMMFTRKHYTDILDNNILLPSLLCCHMLQVVYYIIA